MAGVLSSVALQLEAQSLNSVVAGFSFAAAVAWMDAVRFMISQVVQVSKNGGQYYVLSAIFTTLLSILVFLIMNRALGTKAPSQPIFAVTR